MHTLSVWLSGVSTADIPSEYVPPQSEVVIFTGNHFPTLQWNILGNWNDFKKLEVIDLTNNGIKVGSQENLHFIFIRVADPVV